MMERDELIQNEIEKRISGLETRDLIDLVGYLKHIEQVRTITSSKQLALHEIQTAFKEGCTF